MRRLLEASRTLSCRKPSLFYEATAQTEDLHQEKVAIPSCLATVGVSGMTRGVQFHMSKLK